MIKCIRSDSPFITISGGYANAPDVSSTRAGAGMLRYNPASSHLEVSNGDYWIPLDIAFTGIGLTPEAEELLKWAREERNKQLVREQKINDNPALKKAYESLTKAEEHFKMLESLVNTSSSNSN